jgi:hypothetical protein
MTHLNNKLADALRFAHDEFEDKRQVAQCRGDKALAGYYERCRARVATALAEHDAQPASGEFLPSSEQPPFAGIAGCRPLERAPQPAPAPVQVDDDTIMEGWHGAIDDARELFVNAPDARFKSRAERVVSWLKAHRPGAHPPAPAADGAGELPPLPNPQVPFIGCDPSLTDIRGLVDWYKRGATAYARAAIAALRQPVPDALVQVPREALELIANCLPLKHDTMPYAMEALGFAQSEARKALAEHDAQPAPAPVHPCTMGVGCEEAGVCYASANGQPEQCGAHPPAPAADGAGEHVAMLESMIADHAWIPGVKERAALRAAIAALRQPVPDAVRELIDVGCRIRLASDSNMDRTRLSPKDEKDLHLALERAIASQQESRE